ncbi:hypothetical protein J2Y58_003481 [Sphingomonas sp. BE138]|nr:hypothetical protein [Sphingomonas sp. BE138]
MDRVLRFSGLLSDCMVAASSVDGADVKSVDDPDQRVFVGME